MNTQTYVPPAKRVALLDAEVRGMATQIDRCGKRELVFAQEGWALGKGLEPSEARQPPVFGNAAGAKTCCTLKS